MRPSLCWDVCKIPVTNHQPLGHLNNCHPSLPSNPFSNTTGGTVMCGIFTSSSAMGTKLSSEPKLSSPYLIQAPELLACPPLSEPMTPAALIGLPPHLNATSSRNGTVPTLALGLRKSLLHEGVRSQIIVISPFKKQLLSTAMFRLIGWAFPMPGQEGEAREAPRV